MGNEILTELADGVLRIGINRPDKKNALTVAMYAAIGEALKRAEDEHAIRVVLIHGHPKVFTSGNDLGDFRNRPPVAPGEESAARRFLRLISTAPKPVVAAVTGPVVGVGATMLLHCDLVYAGRGARLQFPFVNLGLVPEAGSSLLLPAAVGYQRAAELLMRGGPFSADRAHAMGLVTEVLDDEQVLDSAVAAAKQLAAKPPHALRLTKQLMKQASAGSMAHRIDEEIKHFQQCLASPEAAEAFKAFAEKRAPDFSRF